MAPAFPRELADLVTDSLVDAPAALAACTFLGRTWLPSARRHLFRTLAITPANLAALTAHLKTPAPADTLVPHVRRIHIRREQAGDPEMAFDEFERCLPHAAAFALVHAVATRAPLEAVHVETARPGAFLAVAAADGALAALTEFTLVTDAAADLADVVRLVCAFPLLRKLTLRGDIPALDAFSGDDCTLSPHLHTLTLDVGYALRQFVAWLDDQEDIALQAVCIPAAVGAAHVQRLVENVASSLTTLYVAADILTYLDLSDNECLETLAVLFARVGVPSYPRVALAGLESAAALPALATVVLDFAACRTLDGRGLIEQDIHVLDRVLAQFPALRAVRVRLRPGRGDADRRVVEEADVLVECAARGLVEYVPGGARGPFSV